MSLSYARELLKISLSQLADRIGFDSTSEMAMDILVDVCERQFHSLFKQTSTLVQLTDRSQVNFVDLLSICLHNDGEQFEQLNTYMKQFQSISFSQEIVQFPYKKRNQFYLRIPPKDAPQVIERDQNPATEYIYDWLPLFPDQETPEQPIANNVDPTFDATVYNEQEKKIDKSDSHHRLTLLSFLSKNGDELNSVPIGKRPNRSLPSILYRPRRIIEMEAVAAAAEKAKKDQLEKENNDKDQQQGPPPPLRLTISKTSTTNEKSSLPLKKSSTTPMIDGTTMKKPPSSNPLLTSTSPSINLPKKLVISPTIQQTNESHSQPNPSITSLESTLEKSNDVALDLTKPATVVIPTPSKLPTLKLNIKHVPTPSNTNHDTPTTATKKFQRPPEKVNLKIRTPSLPLFAPPSSTSESTPLISPPLILPNEIRSTAIPPKSFFAEKKPSAEMIDSTNLVEQSASTQSSMKEKKKKKKHHQRESKGNEEKRMKIEQENHTKEAPMDVEPPPPPAIPTESTTTTNPSSSNQPAGGALRLKIKLGKPSAPVESNPSNDLPPPPPEMKTNRIRLTLPLGSKPSIPPTPHRRKSSKVKRVPPSNESHTITPNLLIPTFPFHEDNTNSIDDLPLGERTSPNKPIPNQMDITPMKKKNSQNMKKKSTNKKSNNIVGVAVIEERRIDHDSQEKIWICPSCNIADNGQEPMIQCDLCDDWYHWECVGIAEEPAESISWFCPKCHRSNSSTASAQGIKPSASSKAKRKRASALYQQKQQQQQQQQSQFPLI